MHLWQFPHLHSRLEASRNDQSVLVRQTLRVSFSPQVDWGLELAS
jgi:hypothetical protein